MFLSKASVVLLVGVLGTSWFTGDPFVSAGPLPQGYNQPMPLGYRQQMPQGYNQEMPQGYNQQMPQGNNQQLLQGYNQEMPQGYNQQMPQYQQPTKYVYVNSNPQPQPQVIYVSAPSGSNSNNMPPLVKTLNGLHDWAVNSVQSLLGQRTYSVSI